MKKLLFFASLLLLTISCKKTKTIDEIFAERVKNVLNTEAATITADIEKIKTYIKEKNLTATATPEGIYIVTEDPGLGVEFPTISSNVLCKYKGYLLDGKVFDQNTTGINFNLSGVILGWGIGMQKFKRRSKGKLIIPSSFAYGKNGTGGIPGDSILVFDIELVDFL